MRAFHVGHCASALMLLCMIAAGPRNPLRVVLPPRQVAYSAVFSLAVSGGRGRSALVWQPASRRTLAELTGHAASITHLAFDEQASQVDPAPGPCTALCSTA